MYLLSKSHDIVIDDFQAAPRLMILALWQISRIFCAFGSCWRAISCYPAMIIAHQVQFAWNSRKTYCWILGWVNPSAFGVLVWSRLRWLLKIRNFLEPYGPIHFQVVHNKARERGREGISQILRLLDYTHPILMLCPMFAQELTHTQSHITQGFTWIPKDGYIHERRGLFRYHNTILQRHRRTPQLTQPYSLTYLSL